jgi:tetratricopeptide (TPR) repeat protein
VSNRKNKRFACGIATVCLAAVTAGCAGLDGPQWNFASRSTADTSATASAENSGRRAGGRTAVKSDGPPRTQEAIADFERRRNDAQFLAAETDWRQGNGKKCRESLEKILGRDPGHRGSILLLADVHLEEERSIEAVETLERGVAALPGDAEIAYKLGVALEADGQPAESLHWLHQAAAKEPNNEHYQTALAQAKDAAAAAGDAAASPGTDDTSPQGTGPQAIAGIENEATVAPKAMNASPAAEPSITVPSSAAPSVAAPTRSDVAFQAALADWDAGRKEACEAKLQAIIVDDPKHVDTAILLAEVELSTGRGDVARARVERLVIRNPNDPQVRRACGITYEALGRKELAAACFAQAEQLAAQPAARTITHREQAAREAGISRNREPAVLNVAAPEASPLVAGGELNLTTTDQPTTTGPSSDRDAIERDTSSDLGLSSDQGPPAPSILRFEADVKPSKLGAGPAAGGATGAADADRTRLSAAELLDRGSQALAERNVDAARDAFMEAIRQDRKNSQTAVTAAVAALKNEQPELALQLATFALETLPRSAGLHRVHGTAAYKLGRFAEAEAALRQSLSLDNSQALSYFLLGSVQSRLGKTEAADGQFRHAARLDRRYAVRR